MLLSSDVYNTPVCNRCGLVGTHKHEQGRDVCCNPECGGTIEFVDMPYASKQLLLELESMSVAPRVRLRQINK